MPETPLTDPEGVLVEGGREVGVLVLAGSSGRVLSERCRLLAAEGMTAASVRYFGGPGQPRDLDRVPLETFERPLAMLHERCDRLAVIGTSRGSEAAMLLGALYPEIDAVVGISPSDVGWAALSGDRPQRSSWTRAGEPLPFVPYDDGALAEAEALAAGGPVSCADAFVQSLERYQDRVAAARLPVERIRGELLLAAGGDDALWPSELFASFIQRRRTVRHLTTTVVQHPDAGHRVVLPGETRPPDRGDLALGGTVDADARLGALLWPELLRVLRG